MTGFVNIPPAIKAKITELQAASYDAAFEGAAPPEDRAAIKEHEQLARYNLERTIETHLERAKKAAST